MNSLGVSHVSIFLLLKTKYDPNTAIAEMLFLKHLNFMSPLQNLCSLARTCLLSLDIYPVCDPTSNGFTETLYLVISEEMCWYFSSFKLCAVDILDSLGTVNSKLLIFCPRRNHGHDIKFGGKSRSRHDIKFMVEEKS